MAVVDEIHDTDPRSAAERIIAAAGLEPVTDPGAAERVAAVLRRVRGVR